MRKISSGLPWLARCLERVPGGRRLGLRVAAVIAAVFLLIVVAGVMRAQRAASWAPIDVVESREPLQELPVRIAGPGGQLRPVHAPDATLDLTRIGGLVVGVDLDFIPRAAPVYHVVIRDEADRERFRDEIPANYFREGRFMLRLNGRRFEKGTYTLDIVAASPDGPLYVVASSWFEVLR